ncbi:MAG: STAS-like domain-containing protein [Bdellovibrionaceae bacterium]|nr:STAS-like domain-containing protein [Pseudobdellovibrionaceae bacterium]
MINFVTDFTRVPGGRLREDGPFSGQQFREEHLLPAFKGYSKVTVNLSGAAGFPSSFLEESFGGAVTELGLEVVKSKLEITISDDPFVKEEIEGYISRAGEKLKGKG